MLVIIYGTGLHNTEQIAIAIEEAAKEEGVQTVLKNVNDANIEDVVNADGIAIGSPNYRDKMMPTVQNFLNSLVDIDLSGKVGLAFGSYGWGMEAIEDIHNILTSYGVEMLQELDVKRVSNDIELEKCRKAGSELACRIKDKETICVA